MALTTGARIGPFLVKSSLGEGGMGIVFHALDTKLQREVALKLLPDHFADDPERLARFQREAQVLASLNHPNIAQIYGLEESDKTRCKLRFFIDAAAVSKRQQSRPVQNPVFLTSVTAHNARSSARRHLTRLLWYLSGSSQGDVSLER